MTSVPPVVLCLSGHDPTGGAGIQADIETLNRLGCYPCTVVTAMTVQDTRNVARIIPQATADFLEQALTVIADLPVAAVKIGLLGSAEIACVVWEILDRIGGVPVVLDPILAAGGGSTLADEALTREISFRLIPRATIVTPNTPEARKLTGKDDPDECARELLALGCPNVLVTGTHEEASDVVHRWHHGREVTSYRWPRLPGSYHGSGCTLASALAAGLAQGWSMDVALREAQAFTWEALKHGLALGRGQWLPYRSWPAGGEGP